MIDTLENIVDLRHIFEALPGRTALIQANPPLYTLVACTQGYQQHSNRTKKQLVGRGLFEVFPSNGEDPEDTGQKNLLASFDLVLKNKVTDTLNVQRYDVMDHQGRFTERYWVVTNKPVLNDQGDVCFIIHNPEEITDRIKVKETEEIIKGMQQAFNLFKQMPLGIAILKGPDHIIEMANDAMMRLWGKGNNIVHKPINDILPEVESQGLINLLNNVLITGIPYHGYETAITLIHDGKLKKDYYNFFYQPYFEWPVSKATGVLVCAYEVTDRVNRKIELIENEERFRAIAESSDLFIAISDTSSNVTYFNTSWARLTGRSCEDLIKSGWVDMVHPDDREEYVAVYLSAFNQRKTFSFEFKILDSSGKYRWLLAMSSPRFLPDGSFAGFMSSSIEITDRKLMEEAVAANEEKFRTLLETLPQMTWTNLPSGEVNFCNDRLFDYTGLDFEDMEGWRWQNIVHADDLPYKLERYLKALYDGDGFEMEARYKKSDGSYRWHLSRSLPVRNETGAIILWVGTATDIHDLKEAELAVRESEQKIRTIVESAPFPIGVLTGKEMRIDLANPSIIESWGKEGNVTGKLLSDLLPELRDTEIYDQLNSVFITGVPVNGVNKRFDILVHGKMKTKYFNYSYVPLFDSDMNIKSVMITGADITDLTFAKQNFEESESRMRNLVMSAPVGICIVSVTSFKVEMINNSFLEVVGKQRKEFENAPFWEVLAETAAEYAPILKNICNTGIAYRGDDREVMLIRNGKEEIIFVKFVCEPIKEADGNVSKIIIIVIEVTEQIIARRKIEEVIQKRTKELATANDNLKKSNEQLAQYAYIASHDLQEPLRKVSIFLEMLENSLADLKEDSKHYLSKINSATARMIALIRDVLTYSKLSKENDVFQWVDLVQVFEIVKNDFELLIREKQATLYAENLPHIQAIPLQIFQLISNLVSNALKFSVPGVKPVISIIATKLPEEEIIKHFTGNNAVYYNIECKDNGIGFDQEYALKIFNVFQRLHKKSAYQGTGIGLAMCRKIVQNHQGEIFATSQKGKGAVFNVMLPELQNIDKL